MPYVSINDVKPGMILSHDLHTPQGRLILAKDTTIAEKHFRVFKIWGVTEAQIRSDSSACDTYRPQKLDPETMEQCKNVTRRRFASCDASQSIVQLAAKLYLQRIAKLAATKGCTEFALSAPVLAQKPKTLQPAPDKKSLAQRETELATLPDIFTRILEALNNPRSSAAHVAEIIGADANLSSRLLRLINSPYFGLSKKVDTLQRAVAMAGSRRLVALAAGVSLITFFDDVPEELFDMNSFWRHSIACGGAARLMGDRLGLDGERLFVCGLLHDVGRLVMLRRRPDLVLSAMHTAYTEHCTLHAAEKHIWGYDHGELTGELLSSWSLPDSLVAAVCKHHKQSAAANPDSACIHMADGLAHLLENPSQNAPMPQLYDACWKSLGLRPGDLPQLLERTNNQAKTMHRLFEVNNPGQEMQGAA